MQVSNLPDLLNGHDHIRKNTAGLLEAKEVLIVDIRDFAAIVQDRFMKYIKPVKPGLYYKNNTRPSLVEGTEYYKPNGESFYYTGVYDNINSNLFDIDGKQVLSYEEFKKGNYTDLPQEPINESLLILSVIKEYINEATSSEHYIDFNHEDYIETRYMETEEEIVNLTVKIELILGPLFRKISSFIGEDDFHIYGVSLSGYNLFLSKYIDFRIYDWYRLKEKENDINTGLCD